ncbi:MAG: nucleotidyltransferase family protein [Draconibacterium sp.]
MKQEYSAINSLAKCLTLDHHPERICEIRSQITSESFDIDGWIKFASDQYVLPALFLQLNRANLLPSLPPEYTEQLTQITKRNQERNLAITKQALEIANHLKRDGIEAVFLKGTAHLFLNLYKDPAERMVGDIDLLVDEADILPTIQILEKMGFQSLVKYNRFIHQEMKHYPRMVNYKYAAAVEVHREIVSEPYNRFLPAEVIMAEKKEIEGFSGVYVPSDRHLIMHNMMNAQINDKAYTNKLLLLRQMYDLLLLSKRQDPCKALSDFGFLPKEANAWLALNSELFDIPNQIHYEETHQVRRYIKSFVWFQKHPKTLGLYRTIIYFLMRIKRYVELPFKAISNRDIRAGLWARISDPKWYGKHLESYLNFFNPNRRYRK